jgi:hypothetical protein
MIIFAQCGQGFFAEGMGGKFNVSAAQHARHFQGA